MICKAKRYNDQMICGRCGLQWDVNDPKPPKCLTDRQLGTQRLIKIKQGLGYGARFFNI